MSVALSEKGIVVRPPEPIIRFLTNRAVDDAVRELQTQTPPGLHPHLKDFLSAALKECETQPLVNMIKGIESLTGKMSGLKARINNLQTEISGQDEPQLAQLKHQRVAKAKKPEPLPTSLKPAIGRLARTSLSVLVGINMPRPDIVPLDRQILSLESRLPVHNQLKELRQQAIELSQQTDQLLDKADAHLDSWAVQKPERALVYLWHFPDRLLKIIHEYQKRVIKDPSPQEATWYVTWVLSNIKGLNGKNGFLSQIPETSQKWFRSIFPHIQSPSMALSIFEKPIEEFQKPTWSLLIPTLVNPETMEYIIQNLISSLKTPGFSTGTRDFSDFTQWAFVTSAQRIGIFPEDQPVSPPTPEVCKQPSEKPKQKKGQPQVAPTPVEKEERQFPVICVAPYNSGVQLFLNPDGTVKLVIAKQETITSLTEETVATVFNFKPQDSKIKMAWEDLQKFQRRFYGLSRTGDIVRLDRPLRLGNIDADMKIRFRGVFIYTMGKGKKGIPTYIIYAYGTHDEVFG